MKVADIALPKWPMMATTGKRVTEDQAAEIIVRCCGHLFSNDKAWLRQLAEHAGVREFNSYGEPEAFDWLRDYRPLALQYLCLDNRVAAAYVGGPHGWINWDGRVGESGHNIGKWPSVEEVQEEWRTIAEAFPFLDLRCQLFSGESCEDGIEPLVEFVVKDGRVRAQEPREPMTAYPVDISFQVERLLTTPNAERGCKIEQWKRGLEFARGVRE